VVAEHQDVIPAQDAPGVPGGTPGDDAHHRAGGGQLGERLGGAGQRPGGGGVAHDRRQGAVQVGQQRGRRGGDGRPRQGQGWLEVARLHRS
jgi:hypothetical protein